MVLVKMVYDITASFPREELFGLTIKCAVRLLSIPSNIAEGCARNSSKEYLHFVAISRGSLSELDTQIDIAIMLGYCDQNSPIIIQVQRVGALIGGLHKKFRESIK